MRTCSSACALFAAALLCPRLAADEDSTAPTQHVWMAEPIALDDEVDASVLAGLGDAVQAALEEGADLRLQRGPELLLRPRPSEPAAGPRHARAEELLRRGEEHYVNFEYGPAAASLAEAAALYTVALAELEGDELDKLYRARLLEGLAWLEAGRPEGARLAFTKLATIRPDFEPDPSLMPPQARSTYQQVVGEVMALGTGALELRTEPAGAAVLVDGIPRGETPLTVSGLAQGSHGLKLVLPGYAQVREDFTLSARQTVNRELALAPTPERQSLDRVRKGALRGTDPSALIEDLGLLRSAADVEALVLVGVARRPEGYVVTALRWSPAGRAAAVYVATDRSELEVAAGQLARALLARRWPAAQLPEGAAPLDTDFDRALLGVGPSFGRAEAPAPEEESSALLWAGVGAAALVAGGTIAGLVGYYIYTSSLTPEQEDDRSEVVLSF